ncbi:M56 family metallopeptidase [Flavobacterium beibuense]|uniref:Regulatory sensor-transducer, BlaR1/MecR1 family n=1 Tax=Flavobacterium beibuense TaxID=657326 RepID=A0A444WBV6_9FLAO|nr:M56 family metallopeptidase [Flavobacterium beibuense]RYJ43295.1 Regulatory sensor-transducer, BlaR1/MecR1 family [Flavobacterium beibuense]
MEAFLIKSAISMAVLLLIYKLFLEREKMHRFNRFYLLFSLVFSLSIPFINIPIYVEADPIINSKSAVKITEAAEVANIIMSPQIPVSKAINTDFEPKVNYLAYAIWGIYALVTLILTVRFALNIAQFYKRKRQNEKVPYNGATIVLLEEGILPHTFLNNIFLNKEEYKSQAIEPELYNHELTHVKQRHTLDILFIELLKTVFWFNPLLYFYKKAIQLNHEFLADEKVIETNNVTYYQQLLLNKASLTTATISLASNLNFSITKKRFVMMTKTTPKIKTLALKLATALIVAGIVYFLSIENVAYAGTQQNGKLTATDSINPDSRRDEYFKGVRIIIQDSLRKVFINTPYEKLTLEQKRQYLATVPSKKEEPDGVSEKDYKFSLDQEDSHFYIDNIKISREQFLKYKREEFASSGFKAHGGTVVNGKLEMTFMLYFYTYPYYSKHIKHLNDHYPEKICKITISEKPVKPGKYIIEKTGNEIGKSDKEVMDIRQETIVSAATYNFEEENAKNTHSRAAEFPGGREAFDAYIAKNLDLDSLLQDDKVFIGYTINTDGSVTDVELYGNKDKKINPEIKRVFEASPKWIPQQKDGKPVTTNTVFTYERKNK